LGEALGPCPLEMGGWLTPQKHVSTLNFVARSKRLAVDMGSHNFWDAGARPLGSRAWLNP